jgi:phospholipid transport system substrate-binding protein
LPEIAYLESSRHHGNLYNANDGPKQMTKILSRRSLLQTGLAGLVVGAAGPAWSARSPEDYVKSLTDKVISLANSGTRGKALRGRFANLLDNYVNLKSIANFALGPYQKKLPAKDRAEFQQLVANYAAALFVYYVDDFKGKSLEVIDTATQGNTTTIRSAIVRGNGGRENIRWRLVGSGGNYRVNDVNLKGVWMTLSMKKRFNDVLNRSNGDFEALFAELREAETW